MKNEETIFTEALLKASPQERAAFITHACAGDVDLRLGVEALLEAHEQRGGVLESPPAGIESTAGATDLAGDVSEQVGAVVGHYKLLQQIGEGGMGVVFMAEQLQPVRRRVAVKIIKPGLDTRQVIARFEAERQALAMMDHPNIAKVLDAGATDAGRPYFVMELVKGIPITEYCDQQQLDPRKRLALFIQVCQAVQHAHNKGIIHRDLKPTNVLVTLNDGHPAPKIIDFGIAKATSGQRLTDRTLFTEFRQLIGTPLYMSPEQAEMSAVMDVDTRSDVYSLGVLLYELLTGTTPFDKQRLAKAAFEEVRRILREEEPPRLSTRLSTLGETLATISASRGSDPKRLGQLMRGELDWIAMKALEKDRDRRYGTPSDLARDVERYLADQPVEACPPARFYRFRTMVRRNKAAITTAAVLGIVLLLATVISTWQAVRASKATAAAKIDRDVALEEKAKAIAEKQRAKEHDAVTDAINEFLNKDVLGQASPYHQPGQESAPNRDLKVREALDRAAARITGRFKSEPKVECNVHFTIGTAYLELGEYEKAERHLQAALDLQMKFDRDEDAHDETRTGVEKLALVYLFSKQYVKAEQLLLPEWKKLRETLGDDNPETVWWAGLVGRMYEREGEYAKAEPLLVKTLADERRVFGVKDRRTVETMNELAVVYSALGDYAKSEPLSLEAYNAARAMEGPHSLSAIKLLYNLAVDYKEQRHFDKAELMLLDVVKGYHDVWGDENIDTLTANMELGIVYREAGQLEKAEPLLQRTIEEMRKVLGDKNRRTLEAQDALAGLYFRKEQFDKAATLFLEVLETQRKVLGEYDSDTWRTGHHLGALYMRQHQFTKAEAIMLRNLEIARKIFGVREFNRFVSAGSLAAVYFSIGSYERAEPLYREELEGLKARGTTDPEIFGAMSHLARTCLKEGKTAEGVALQREMMEALLAHPHSELADPVLEDLTFYRDRTKPDQVAQWEQVLKSLVEAALERKSKDAGQRRADTAEARASLRYRAALHQMLGRFEEALADVTSALKSDPTNLELLEAAANLHLYLGHEREYQTIRSELIRLSVDSKGDHPAKTCLLYPLACEEAKAVKAMTDRALSSGASAFILQFFHSAKGMDEYRRKNYADAVEWLTLARDALTKTIETRPANLEFDIWDEVRTTNEFFLAMAESRLGHQQQAREILARAQEQLRTLIPSASSVHGRLATTDWLMVQIVAREAERTVNGTAPSSKPSTIPATRPAAVTQPGDSHVLKNAQDARP